MGLRLIIAAAAGTMLLAAAAAHGQEEGATAEAVRARIANFREIGTAMKTIDDELKSGKPYLPAVETAAGQIRSLGADIDKWFPPGTVPALPATRGILGRLKALVMGDSQVVAGVKTKALHEVDVRPQEFAARHTAFMAEAEKMAAAAKAGALPEMQAQRKALGDSCDACHTPFRLD
jgi:cytochrome c556